MQTVETVHRAIDLLERGETRGRDPAYCVALVRDRIDGLREAQPESAVDLSARLLEVLRQRLATPESDSEGYRHHDGLRRQWVYAWLATREAVSAGHEDANEFWEIWASTDRELRELIGLSAYEEWTDSVAPVDGHWLPGASPMGV